MTTLDAAPDRIAAARRAQSKEWTFGPEGPVALTSDPVLAEMALFGLIAPHYLTPEQQIAGRDDYFRLTEAGQAWLDAAGEVTA